MLTHLKRYWWAYAAALIYLEVLDSLISLLQTCNAQYDPSANTYSYANSCKFLHGPVITRVVWFARLFDANGIIAIFTGVLALSTIALWSETKILGVATKESADAADRSARAAIALKLPLIRIWPDNISHGTMAVGDKQIEDCSIYSVKLYNLGETKAFPTEIIYGWAVGDSLPPEPKYEKLDKFPVNTFLVPESEKTPPIITATKHLRGSQILEPEDWSRICRGNYLWFYCMLLYGDFMDEKHTHGFCWRWAGGIAGGMGWIADATPAYNRKT